MERVFTNAGDRLMSNGALEEFGLSTAKAPPGTVFIPGGTFRMGSDRHYPEEAPVHAVTVDGVWMDRSQLPTAPFANSSRRPATSPSRKLSPIQKIIPARCRIC